MIKIYGIPNCDTVKKALSFLKTHQLDYTFHDYKKLGIDAKTLQSWCDKFGYEKVLNQRGTTWRKLPEEEKKDLDEARAIALMLEHTSMIKRPVLESGKRKLLGFNQSEYESLL